MGSVPGWIDLAKWTCFGLYFVLEDLTIVGFSRHGCNGANTGVVACHGRL